MVLEQARASWKNYRTATRGAGSASNFGSVGPGAAASGANHFVFQVAESLHSRREAVLWRLLSTASHARDTCPGPVVAPCVWTATSSSELG